MVIHGRRGTCCHPYWMNSKKEEIFHILIHIYFTILNPGSASSAAEDLKRRKYPQLVADFEFVPVAVETSGIIGSAGCSLLTDIGRRISRATNDPHQMSYIFQQISVAIIRGNALAITASSRKYVQELVERH